ncbi:MAG TPA: hypothetical protein VHY21_09605 [Pseudonocardiaceae bacterium]|nr:hypothetical protein [Pseudonocardiaceae bacterium]
MTLAAVDLLPDLWFADRRGFAVQDALATWLRWLDFAATTFEDLANGWMPFNKPRSYAQGELLRCASHPAGANYRSSTGAGGDPFAPPRRWGLARIMPA